MGEGLIGFIIFMIILNIGSRIMRGLMQKPKPGTGGKKTGLQALIEELQQETAKPKVPAEAFGQPEGDTLPLREAEFPESEITGSYGQAEIPPGGGWEEDAFEETPESLPGSEPAPIPESYEGLVLSPEEISPVGGIEYPRGELQRRSIDQILEGLPYFQQAVVLREILGPCRATRRGSYGRYS
ncbi:MAG: hypothetical protein JXB45_07715 [Candidatus Krumholzibacteriota bacterium]|nr:hypothetical protein [Candidatus Krumholzibacteriota bacterium]